MRTDRTVRAAGAAAAMLIALAAGGCGETPPKEQVVATVDGKDITRRDVVAELQAARVPANVDVKAVQPLVAQQIVDRTLLAGEAKKQGLDKTPDYLAALRRATDQLLAQQLVTKWTGEIREPGDAEVRAFIAENPAMFADRRILRVEQLRTPQAGLDLARVERATSMDEVIAILKEQHRPFERGRSTIDTLQLSKDAARQVAGLPAGMPFANADGTNVVFNVVAEAIDRPLPDAAEARIAKAAIRETLARKTVSDRIGRLKAGAKIDYQPGFAPPAPKG